jgi:hypothetical protein
MQVQTIGDQTLKPFLKLNMVSIKMESIYIEDDVS